MLHSHKNRRGRAWAAIAFAILLALGAIPAQAQSPAPHSPAPHSPAQQTPAAASATMTARLAAELAATPGPVDFLVILRDQLDPQQTVAASAAAQGTTQARAAVLYDALRTHAATTQASLRAWLDAQQVPYRPFYIVNMLLLTGDAALAEALLARPEVARLAANPPAQGVQARRSGLSSWPAAWQVVQQRAGAAAALPWGLEFTHAPDVWAQGYDGTGIVIASQDTGVQWDHEALKAHYRGWSSATLTATHAYNWFDAFGADGARAAICPGAAATDPQIPCDDNGHGTHTVGTLLGDATPAGGTLLGMAPGATWIGCRNMSAGVGNPASYTACFEFFLAPYPQGGDPAADGRPDLAPHIINNSWGCPPYEGCDDPNILRSVVETARAAGQFVVASAGNSGPSCSTVIDPIGIYDAVFSVGALSSSGGIASFSSRGPVTIDGSGRLKPDLSAPGSGVYSSEPLNGYGFKSGTSMAAPHVAGAVALLWSAQPDLIGDIDATEMILRASAVPVASLSCNASATGPNPVYGAGWLDAAAAVAMAKAPATLAITVVNTDSVTLPGVEVVVEDVRSGATFTATTNAQGQASFTLYTREWTGNRSAEFVLDTGTRAHLIINTPFSLYLPQLNTR